MEVKFSCPTSMKLHTSASADLAEELRWLNDGDIADIFFLHGSYTPDHCTSRDDRRDCKSIERWCHRYYTFGSVRAALLPRILGTPLTSSGGDTTYPYRRSRLLLRSKL